MGGIAVPLFSLFGVEALEYRLGNCGAKAVVTDATGAAKLAQIRDRQPDLKLVLRIDGAGGGELDFHGLIDASRSLPPRLAWLPFWARPWPACSRKEYDLPVPAKTSGVSHGVYGHPILLRHRTVAVWMLHHRVA